jgi:hypothetical protein
MCFGRVDTKVDAQRAASDMADIARDRFQVNSAFVFLYPAMMAGHASFRFEAF